jgi:uncharacterized protein (UPF0305 family)
MKAQDLLAEIKENIKDYDIKYLEEKIKDENINQISKQVSAFNIENYNEIMKLDIDENSAENVEIGDKLIKDIKEEMARFFDGCSPESEEVFKRFVTYICIYLSLIAKKPMHPIGMDFRDGNTVFSEEKDGEILYYCDKKQRQAKISKDYYTCKYCICIPTELKE